MADRVQEVCGVKNQEFSTFEEAMQCKVKLEEADKKPYIATTVKTDGAEDSPPELYYSVTEFTACAVPSTTATLFDSWSTTNNRFKAKVCAESLTRVAGQNYTFQPVPDNWVGTFDSYSVVLASDYTGAQPGARFSSKEAAQDAAEALKAKNGKEYTVVNTGADYIVEEKK